MGNAKGPGGFFIPSFLLESSSVVVKYFKMTAINIKSKIVHVIIILKILLSSGRYDDFVNIGIFLTPFFVTHVLFHTRLPIFSGYLLRLTLSPQ